MIVKNHEFRFVSSCVRKSMIASWTCQVLPKSKVEYWVYLLHYIARNPNLLNCHRYLIKRECSSTDHNEIITYVSPFKTSVPKMKINKSFYEDVYKSLIDTFKAVNNEVFNEIEPFQGRSFTCITKKPHDWLIAPTLLLDLRPLKLWSLKKWILLVNG